MRLKESEELKLGFWSSSLSLSFPSSLRPPSFLIPPPFLSPSDSIRIFSLLKIRRRPLFLLRAAWIERAADAFVSNKSISSFFYQLPNVTAGEQYSRKKIHFFRSYFFNPWEIGRKSNGSRRKQQVYGNQPYFVELSYFSLQHTYSVLKKNVRDHVRYK